MYTQIHRNRQTHTYIQIKKNKSFKKEEEKDYLEVLFIEKPTRDPICELGGSSVGSVSR